MGILGDLLYPHNTEMAQELNSKEDKLRKENNLHNNLVNSYRLIGEKTKTFDGYLMGLTALQYHLAYTEEDLSNLPDTDLPKISQSIIDSIESGALDILTAKMATDGIKALKNGISNLVRQSGIFSRTAPEGEAAVSEGLGANIEAVSLETPLLSSGTVEALTTESTEAAGELSGELGELSGSVTEAVDSISAEGEEISAEAEEAAETAETAASAAEAGEAAETAEAGEAGAGFSAVLGPILMVVIVVTEILSAIKAGQTETKLKEAETKMDDLLSKSEKSLKDLKQVFTHLLNAAKTDIQAYNKMLPDLYAISQEESLNRSAFSTAGIDAFIKGMDLISIDQDGTAGYQSVAVVNLDDAQQFLSLHASSTSQAAEIVKQIKTHMAKKGLTDVPDNDPFLQSIADANSIELAVVQGYNSYRRDIAEVAAMLKPYHEQVVANTPPNAKLAKPPQTAKTGTADPNFVPKPNQFKIPTVKLSSSS